MRVATVVLALLLAGCQSSPPVHFYMLGPLPPAARAGGEHPPVQIAAVNIPPALDRQEMVRASGPNTLEISNSHRWGGPVADMVQDVLTADLMQRLPGHHVIPPNIAAPAATCEITLDILEFQRDAAGNVVLNGGWSLYREGSDTPLFNRDIRLSEPTPTAYYESQAGVMSQLLARLADEIVAALPVR